MGADQGIAAIAASLPVLGPDPVASLRDDATPVLPAPAAPPPAAPVDIAQLSVTGKLLAALLQTSPAAPAAHAAPLLGSPTAEAPVIAGALRAGIEHSGLFYESHLADWVSGQRELESLAREPQMNGKAADDMPAILRQQLDMLDNQPLQWRGELWQGMPVQLQVGRQAAQNRGGASEQRPDTWTSTLVSELPSLGSVIATLRIDGDRLQLRLHAAGAASALLAERSGELRDALAVAGLRLQRFDADGERQA